MSNSSACKSIWSIYVGCVCFIYKKFVRTVKAWAFWSGHRHNGKRNIAHYHLFLLFITLSLVPSSLLLSHIINLCPIYCAQSVLNAIIFVLLILYNVNFFLDMLLLSVQMLYVYFSQYWSLIPLYRKGKQENEYRFRYFSTGITEGNKYFETCYMF